MATSWLSAKVTGQEYTIVDGVFAAISGAVAATKYSVIAGLISGAYTGLVTYWNGASFGGAVAAGTIASLVAVSAYSGMVKVSTGKELGIVATVFVDTVFTSEFNIVAATTSKSAVVANKNSKYSSSSNTAGGRDTTGFSKPVIDHKIKHRYRGIQE